MYSRCSFTSTVFVFSSYTRKDDSIRSLLSAKWHDDEFLGANLVFQKMYQTISDFTASTRLDVSSSFKGMTSLLTGAEVKRQTGLFESQAYIKVSEGIYVTTLVLLLEGNQQNSMVYFTVNINFNGEWK